MTSSYDYLDETVLRALMEIHRNNIDILIDQAKAYGEVETMAPINIQNQLDAERKKFSELYRRLEITR